MCSLIVCDAFGISRHGAYLRARCLEYQSTLQSNQLMVRACRLGRVPDCFRVRLRSKWERQEDTEAVLHCSAR